MKTNYRYPSLFPLNIKALSFDNIIHIDIADNDRGGAGATFPIRLIIAFFFMH